jgi:hypothetical protein
VESCANNDGAFRVFGIGTDKRRKANFATSRKCPHAADALMRFRRLPQEIRIHALETRSSCFESDPERKFQYMQGIISLKLDRAGSNGIVVDDQELCGAHIAGMNCSNRGCDLKIWKEMSKNRWSKVFDEHAHSKYLVIDWEEMRLQMMVVSIYAGDPRCRPVPNRNYTSGMSCNLLVTYRDGRWNWQVGAVVSTWSLLIRRQQRACRQAEIPLSALCRFPAPALITLGIFGTGDTMATQPLNTICSINSGWK